MTNSETSRQKRQEQLKNIIKDLHAGVDVEEIKARFGDLLDQVGPTEIGEMEQSLVDEGLPVEEIQKLCDVHVAVFKESLEKQKAAELLADLEVTDPIVSFQNENEKIGQLVGEIKDTLAKIKENTQDVDLIRDWREKHEKLLEVDAHYSRKENILFPYLERHNISGPPAVMWGVHDEIRASLKEVSNLISSARENPALAADIDRVALPALDAVLDMIYKEENILFPMCKDTLQEEEWDAVRAQLKDPAASVYQRVPQDGLAKEGIELDVGALTPEQINLVLTHLPIDITYVDENDEVRYFSLGPERIFERARAVIGRKVQFCHPPSSMGIVDQILDDFKSGRKDSAEFWINMKGQLIYIRYFAVRDKDGTYRGTLEASQNITEIQKLKGEKRIYDY
ncbi:MAG TPA: DUF438 domain-containing protein [Firmicutes bacterium]|nr:DUF438 domain-containing protein [Bacillota bacterium]